MEPENSLPPVPCFGQALGIIEEDEKPCHSAAFAIQNDCAKLFILQTICNLHPIGRKVKISLRVGYNQYWEKKGIQRITGSNIY